MSSKNCVLPAQMVYSNNPILGPSEKAASVTNKEHLSLAEGVHLRENEVFLMSQTGLFPGGLFNVQ